MSSTPHKRESGFDSDIRPGNACRMDLSGCQAKSGLADLD
jgi:hypothetical protein